MNRAAERSKLLTSATASAHRSTNHLGAAGANAARPAPSRENGLRESLMKKWKCVRCGSSITIESEDAATREGWRVGAFLEELVGAQPALCPDCQQPHRELQ